MQNNESNKFNWRAAKTGCTLLFALFSFLYLYFMQPDLLTSIQYILSGGVTSYSPAIGSIIIVFLLVLLGELMAAVFVLPVPFLALSYLPSTLLLGIMTGVNLSAGSVGVNGTTLWIALSAALVGFMMISLVRKYSSFLFPRKLSLLDAWPNALLLFIQFLLIGGMGNTKDGLHVELKAERYLHENRSSEIPALNYQTAETSQNLLAMRALALAERHELGNQLFSVWQKHGVSGLICQEDNFYSYDSLAYEFYNFWGARPGEHVKKNPALFFEMVLERGLCDSLRCKDIADYYLCALLLDRQLDSFPEKLKQHYVLNDSLPRYYQEALILSADLTSRGDEFFDDTSVNQRYKEFCSLLNDRHIPAEEKESRLRRDFGHTYWYYYRVNK